MKQFMQRVFLSLAVAPAMGCSNVNMPSLDGVFGGERGSAIHVTDSRKSNPTLPKYAASIRINRYTDARNMGNPRKIGTGAEYVFGLSGKDIVLDQDVAVIVTGAMKARLDDAGFQVSDAQNSNAQFELSGVVKELALDVKSRDEVSIAIETTLSETSSGKVVWSGNVVEKNDRFAGVSGNNKNDIADYLRKELGIATDKTTEAISASLLASRPEIFNMTSGAKAIPGVTVLVAPTVANIPTPALPVQQIAPTPALVVAPAQAYTPHATAASGLLLINTKPARAKVYLDDVYYGLSPLRLEMEPGVHAVRVKLDGYKTVVEKVSVRRGDSTEMDMNLEH